MKQEKVIKTLSKMIMAYNTLEAMGKAENLATVADGMGYSSERVIKAIDFIHGQVGTMNQEKANEIVERNAHIAYLESIDEIEKYMEMAKGYQEMGEINLTISQEDHHLEEEGVKLHEVDSKESKGDTQAG
jgi:hypothetical protein